MTVGKQADTIALKAVPRNAWGKILKHARGTRPQTNVVDAVKSTGIGFSQSMLSAWENGTRSPRVYSEAFKRLLRVLDLLDSNDEISADFIKVATGSDQAVSSADPNKESLRRAQQRVEETIAKEEGIAELWLFGARDLPVIDVGEVRTLWTENILAGVNYNIVWFVDKVENDYARILDVLTSVSRDVLIELSRSDTAKEAGKIKHYFVNLTEPAGSKVRREIFSINTALTLELKIEDGNVVNWLAPELIAYTPDMEFQEKYSDFDLTSANNDADYSDFIGLRLYYGADPNSRKTFVANIHDDDVSKMRKSRNWLFDWMSLRDIWIEEWSPGSSIVIYDLKAEVRELLGFEQVYLRDSKSFSSRGNPRLVTLEKKTFERLHGSTWKFTRLLNEMKREYESIEQNHSQGVLDAS